MNMDAGTQGSAKKIKHVQKEVAFTLRGSPYTYLQLSLKHVGEPADRAPFDTLTARTYLTSALSQYLGLTGTAIPIDILKVTERDCWIRVPKDDASAVTAAIGQWANALVPVSMIVEGRGDWLGGVVATGETRRDKLFSLEK